MEAIGLLFLVLAIALFVVVPIAVLVRVSRIGRSAEELNRKVDALRKAVDELKGGGAPKKPAPAEEPAVKPIALKPPRPPERPPVHPAPERHAALAAAARAFVEAAPEAKPEPAPAANPDEPYEPGPIELFFARIQDWVTVSGAFAPEGMSREFAVATRWLLRIGILLIVGSVAYFMKLSIDRGWVGPAQRVAGTILFGGAMSVAGAWAVKCRRNYAVLGHALAAIGFASLYLGFGMGHRFFNPPVIASAPLAFAALAAVTVFGAVMAVALDAPAISVLSLVGGYLVPVIAGHDTGSPLKLDIYLIMLNLGAFAVARIRRWSVLDFLASAAAYAMCFVWCHGHASAFSRGNVAVNLAFLAAVHFLYLAAVVASSKTRSKPGNAIAWAGLALNACAFTGWMTYAVQTAYSRAWAGAVLLALTAAYVALAAASLRRGWTDRGCVNITLFFALAFLWAAPVLLVDGAYLAPCWCLIAVACAESARASGMRLLRGFGWCVLAVAALSASGYGVEAYMGAANGAASAGTAWAQAFAARAVKLGAVPAAFAFLAWRAAKDAPGGAQTKILAAGAFATSFLYLSGEASLFTRAFAPGLRGGGVTLAWGLYASALILGGVLKRAKAVRVTGLCVLAAAVVKLLGFDTAHLDMPWRVGTFALTGTLLLAGAFVYLKFRKDFADEK